MTLVLFYELECRLQIDQTSSKISIGCNSPMKNREGGSEALAKKKNPLIFDPLFTLTIIEIKTFAINTNKYCLTNQGQIYLEKFEERHWTLGLFIYEFIAS